MSNQKYSGEVNLDHPAIDAPRPPLIQEGELIITTLFSLSSR